LILGLVIFFLSLSLHIVLFYIHYSAGFLPSTVFLGYLDDSGLEVQHEIMKSSKKITSPLVTPQKKSVGFKKEVLANKNIHLFFATCTLVN